MCLFLSVSMEKEIKINGLFREELDPKLYDIISELKTKFGIMGNLDVVIIEDPTSYQSHLSASSMFRINYRLQVTYDNTLTITRGVFTKLHLNTHPEQLKTLIAHEFSHIFNKDSFFGAIIKSVWIIFPFIILALVNYLLQNICISLLFFAISSVIMGRIFTSWNRKKEIRCDMDAAIITHNPEALILALKTICITFNDVKDIMLPLEKPRSYCRKLYYLIFGNTHPSLEERIKNIESLKQG